MFNIKIEYLIPFLTSSPTYIRFIAIVWIVITIFLASWLSINTYKKNMEKAQVEASSKYIKIERFIDDFDKSISRILKGHEDDINRIGSNYNVKGAYASGAHLEYQYKAVQNNQLNIENGWISTKRVIEDELIKLGLTEIKDKKIGEKYTQLENRKSESLNKIMDLTDKYFEKREGTFSTNDVQNVKKQVFGN